MSPVTSARPFVRERASGCFWYGKWSRHGQPVIRALGPAWVEPDGIGGWKRKRGRAPEGVITEAEAAQRMLTLMREHDAEHTLLERDADERRRRGDATFHDLLAWARDLLRSHPDVRRAAQGRWDRVIGDEF